MLLQAAAGQQAAGHPSRRDRWRPVLHTMALWALFQLLLLPVLLRQAKKAMEAGALVAADTTYMHLPLVSCPLFAAAAAAAASGQEGDGGWCAGGSRHNLHALASCLMSFVCCCCCCCCCVRPRRRWRLVRWWQQTQPTCTCLLSHVLCLLLLLLLLLLRQAKKAMEAGVLVAADTTYMHLPLVSCPLFAAAAAAAAAASGQEGHGGWCAGV
jgi:hypothetical protein